MKRTFLIAVLIATGLFILNCGGSGSTPLSLNVQPAAASAFTDFTNGTYQAVGLTATLSSGQMPTGLKWTTNIPCVAVGSSIGNTATVVCNFTCGGGPATATITATAQGLTGTSSVTCTWS